MNYSISHFHFIFMSSFDPTLEHHHPELDHREGCRSTTIQEPQHHMIPALRTKKKKKKNNELVYSTSKKGQRVMDDSKAPREPQELYILVTGANRYANSQLTRSPTPCPRGSVPKKGGPQTNHLRSPQRPGLFDMLSPRR